MSDVVDIVHKLTFELDAKGLTDANDELNKQLTITKQLSANADSLTKKIAATTDPAKQKAYTTYLDATNKALAAQVGAITQIINANPKLKQQYDQEITVVQTLSQKLANLKASRDAATDPAQYAAITAQIKALQSELNGGALGGTNVLSTILGIGGGAAGTAKQLLTGVLTGIGVGGGFGVITKLTSGFVELIKDATDTEARFEDLEKATSGLNNALDELGNNLNKISQTREQANIPIDQTTEAFKRNADLIKSQGVFNRDAFSAQQRDFDAQNKANDNAIKDAERQNNLSGQLKTTYAQIAKNAALTRSYYQELYPKGDEELINQVSRFDIQSKTIATLQKSGLDQSVIDKTVADFNSQFKKAEENYFKGGDFPDLAKLLSEQFTKNSADANGAAQKLAEAQAKQQEDANAQAAKRREAQDNLLHTLDLQNFAEQDALNNKKLESEVQNEEKINEEIELLRSQKLRDLSMRKADEIKLIGDLTPTLIASYKKQGDDINAALNQQRDEQIRQVKIQQRKQQEALNQQIDTQNVSSAQNNISFLAPNDYEGLLAKQQVFIAQQATLQRTSVDNAYTEQKAELEREQAQLELDGKATTDRYKTVQNNLLDLQILHNQQKDDIDRQENQKQLQAINDFYAEEKAAILNFDQDIANITIQEYQKLNDLDDKFFKGRITRQGLAYKTQITQLQANIDTASENLKSYTKFRIDNENTYEDRINDRNRLASDPNATQAQIDDNNKALITATANLNKATEEQNKAANTLKSDTLALQDAEKKHFEEQVQHYIDLVGAVKNAYDQIAAIEQQNLDREISIQEQRVQQANVLAERGNTAALQQEEKALNQQLAQREKIAKRQILINTAVTASEAILGVVKAAAEGDPYTIAIRVIAAVAAIAAGIAEVKAQTYSQTSTVGFFKGGYTGDGGKYQVAGDVHRGEFVFDQEKTRQHKQLFEKIHRGEDITPYAFRTLAPVYHTDTTRNQSTDFYMLADKLDNIEVALAGRGVNVNHRIDKDGFHLMVEEHSAAKRRAVKLLNQR